MAWYSLKRTFFDLRALEEPVPSEAALLLQGADVPGYRQAMRRICGELDRARRYRRALALYCLECEMDGAPGPATWRTRLRAFWHAPRHLLVSLPADVRRAHAEGVTAEVVECVRGLQDGYHDRPLPLERLGLR